MALCAHAQLGDVTVTWEITSAQCRAARALLGWGQGRLAEKAKVALKTLVDFERGNRSPHDATLDSLQAALGRAGVEFIPENGGGPGVRLRKPPARRKCNAWAHRSPNH